MLATNWTRQKLGSHGSIKFISKQRGGAGRYIVEQKRDKTKTPRLQKDSVVRRLTVGPTGQRNPARDSNPESPDFCY